MSTQPGPATPAVATHFEPYVSVEKAAEYLDIAPKTLLKKARKGEVPAYPWIAARLFLKGKGFNEKEAYE